MMNRVAYSMPPTFSPFEKKSAAAQCPIYDRSCPEELSISPEMTPAQDVALEFVGGFCFCLYVGFSPNRRVYSLFCF